MSTAEYLIGAAQLTAVCGFALLVATRVYAARLSTLHGAAAVVAIATLATASLLIFHLLPATLGLLSRGSVLAVAAGAGLGAHLVTRGSSFPRGMLATRLARPASGLEWLGLAALIAVGAMVLGDSIHLAAAPLTSVDAATFHLPGTIRWIQEGSIWNIAQFVPDQTHGYYPMNGNLAMLAAILPWHSDFAIRLVGLPFFALGLIATYATSRELGASRGASYLAAAAAFSVPAVTLYVAGTLTPDIFMLGTFAVGALFLTRHLRTGGGTDLLMAGVALGLSFGSRWYAVSTVAALVAIWLIAQIRRIGARSTARTAGLLIMPIIGLGSIWLIRNLVQAGNPLFPLNLSVFGIEILQAPGDRLGDLLGASIASYWNDGGALTGQILPALWRRFGAISVIAAVGTLIAIGVAISRIRRGDARLNHPAVLPIGFAALAVFVIYLLTPFSALGLPGEPTQVDVNTRYGVPALVLAAPLAGTMLDRGRRLRACLGALALVAIGLALGGGPEVPAAVLLLSAGLLGLLAAVLLRSRHALRLITATPTGLTVAAIAVLGLMGGYALERRFLSDRYAGQFATIDRVIAETAQRPATIAVAGNWDLRGLQPILPLFGPRFENEVEFLGSFEQGMLRAARSRSEFERALRERDDDLLLIGRLDLPLGPQPQEEAWTRRAGWTRIAGDSRFTLWLRP